MRRNPERRQQIIDLRNQERTVRQIAEQLGISTNLVSSYIHSLIRKGIIEPISKQESNRRQTVTHRVDVVAARQMRLDGKSYREIGEHYDVSGPTIKKLIGGSVRITPIQQQVISLRTQGLSYREMPSHLGKTVGTIAVIVSRLVKKGLI